MKLYNTLSRKVEDFKPLKDNQVSLYSCGPTVYDKAHIGNLSSFIFSDILNKTLRSSGYTVNHVMNLTDVDDKTIKRSKEDYKDLEPMDALIKLVRLVEQDFLKDMSAIGNDIDSIDFIRATESIQEMLTLVSDLHSKGFAYIADDGVYFSIEKYIESGKTYGQLTTVNTKDTSQSRISNDEYDKDSANDFALWKKAKDDEPKWEFELDGISLDGRPGWHIECSAMSVSKLGQPFDIHTGGIDLIFPHHENEIAQSTAGKENPTYANYFAHNGHLYVEGKKMSKSLNNFYTLEDVQAKGFDPQVFRLVVLQSHYRSQANFSWEILGAAQNRLNRWRDAIDLMWQEDAAADSTFQDTDYSDRIKQALQDDLNTPKALTVIDVAISQLEQLHICKPCIENFANDIKLLLGIDLLAGKTDISDAQKELLAERQAARNNKQWDQSDKLRDQLKVDGIEVRDTTKGQIWSRT